MRLTVAECGPFVFCRECCTEINNYPCSFVFCSQTNHLATSFDPRVSKVSVRSFSTYFSRQNRATSRQKRRCRLKPTLSHCCEHFHFLAHKTFIFFFCAGEVKRFLSSSDHKGSPFENKTIERTLSVEIAGTPGKFPLWLFKTHSGEKLRGASFLPPRRLYSWVDSASNLPVVPSEFRVQGEGVGGHFYVPQY